MVSSKTKKSISLAISLLVAVISLTGTALAAIAPTVTTQARYAPGFAGMPGKMAADAAGNLFVADFWGKGIVKLDRTGNRIGFIPTLGRPSALAIKADGRLVVAMSSPQKYVAFYSQAGEELAQFGAPAQPYFKPTSITIDASGYIYVLDSGELNGTVSDNIPTVRVYGSEGNYLYAFGTKTLSSANAVTTVAGQGNFRVPQGIAYEKANNQIYVADSGNGRLQVFGAYNGSSCAFVKFLGIPAGRTNGTTTNPGASIKFGDPVDIAFEYNGAALDRVYVADRVRHEISVIDPAAASTLALIRLASVAGANLNQPSALVLQKGSTGAVLYTASAPISTGANVVAFGIDGGSPQPPTVSLALTTPVSPATTSSSLALSGTVSPVYAVNCTVNGGSDNPATPSGSAWDVTLTLVNGNNNIVCRATDGTVTSYVSATTYYEVALQPGPGVSITPLPSNYTNNTSILISGTTNAANANIKLTNASNDETVTTTSGANKTWSASITLSNEDGANVITASAWKTGTQVDTANVTVTVDRTPPNLASMISFLANNATTVTAIQNLDGVVIEKNLSSVTVNDDPATALVALPTADNTYYSAPVTLVRGSNSVTVRATDLAGNIASLSRTVTLNPEIPGLGVALPASNSYLTGAGTVPANGSVETTFASVDACGTPVTPAAGSWSTAVMSVSSGFNSCLFVASGGGNVAVSEKRTILADAVYAKLAITSPAADLATSSSSVLLTGEVAIGSATPTISINGAAAIPVTSYDSGTGLFSHTVALGLDGTTTTVKVMANGATAAVRNILRDSSAPVMAIQANSNVAPSTISGAIEPSAKLAGVTARIDGVDTSLPIASVVTFDAYNQSKPAAVWHANLVGYNYDSIKFTTIDPAGNETQRTFVNGIPTGDVDRDGAVRLSDAMACLRHVAGTELLSGSDLDKNTPRFQADVGSLIEERAAQDGAVTVEDAMLILLKAYGLKSF